MIAFFLPHPDNTVIVALIAAAASIIITLLERSNLRLKRLEHKIDGIKNGFPSDVKRALAQLLREKAERDIYGLPMRRVGDVTHVHEDPVSTAETHNANELPNHNHEGGREPGHTHSRGIP